MHHRQRSDINRYVTALELDVEDGSSTLTPEKLYEADFASVLRRADEAGSMRDGREATLLINLLYSMLDERVAPPSTDFSSGPVTNLAEARELMLANRGEQQPSFRASMFVLEGNLPDSGS